MPSDTFNLQIFDTGISIPALHATSHLTGGTDAIPTAVASVAGEGGSAGLMSALQAQQLVTNNGKVTNADHDGDVSGSTTLTIANDAITTAKIALNAVIADKIASDAVTTTKIADGNVTLAKLANVTGPVVLGRSDSSLGGVSAISCTALGFDLISKATAELMRSTLGLGSLATQASNSVAITGGTISGVTLSGISVNVSNATGTLPASHGGTGIASYTSGDLLYASGLTAISALPKGATNYVLHGSGLGATPSWGLVNLATDVTGILPQANGGTGGASIDTLTFDTTDVSTDALATGEIRWNDADKTLDLKLAGDVTLQIGQETNIYVHNSESSTIPNGSVVYIFGADNDNPSVMLATNADSTAKKTLGVTTQSIPAGGHGYVTTQGLVRGLNTSAFGSGDPLWLGVSGALTTIEPVYPATAVRVAIVVRDDVALGSIFVQPQLFSDGRVSGTFQWGTATGTGSTQTVAGLSSTSKVIIQQRGSSVVNSFYSVVCVTNGFTPYAIIGHGGSLPIATTEFSYIAFI